MRRTNQKHNLVRLVAVILAVTLGVGFNPCQAVAAESTTNLNVTNVTGQIDFDDPNMVWTIVGEGNENARVVHLHSCSIGMGYSSEGLHMSFITNSSDRAEEIGVSDIKVQKKIGIFWSTVGTSVGAYETDSYDFGGSSLFTGVEYGSSYRVSCVHYAYINGQYVSLDNQTDWHECTY